MSYEHEPEPWSIADTIGELRAFPSPVVWAAGAIIVAAAAFGLYQGVRGGMNGGAGANPEEAATGDAVSAQAAQPLTSSAQWSALSGPAMASNTAPQAASAQPESDAQDETDNAAPESESAAPVAVSAAPQPLPQPVSAAPAPQSQPVPAAQPPAQSQPVPGTY